MGMYLYDLARVLRGAGLDVQEAPGWQRRGFKAKTTPDGGLIGLTGGLVHHTATPAKIKGDYPTYNLILAGRIDVPGPLSQLGLGRSGKWYVFAAGRANHSGAVDDWRYANPRSIGVEAEHAGVGIWPVQQYLSYVTGCAALSKAYGINWRGHREAAVPYGRKVDPTFPLDTFRAHVAKGSALIRTQLEDDMYGDADRERDQKVAWLLNNSVAPAVGRIETRTWQLVQEIGRGDVDPEAIAAAVISQLTPERIAGLIPPGVAASVADQLEIRVREQGAA